MSPGKSTDRRPLVDDIAKPEEVAEALGISNGALTQMRWRRTGPPYPSVG
jgi:hypothetical protein